MAAVATAADRCAVDLHPIGTHAIPSTAQVDGYRVGGISGLDYDARTRQWYLVSDDRTEYSAARIFTLKLRFDAQRVIDVSLQSGVLVDSETATDAETIRVDSRHRELLLAGEGDVARQIGPWLRRMNFSGRELEHVPLPPLFFASSERGPRPNGSIEGIALDRAGRGVWIALEMPLRQDGPVANVDGGVDVRFTLRRSDNSTVQYAYPVDAARTHTGGESSDNGVSEILAVSEHELLVLERSGIRHADRSFSFHTRLYCADVKDATDVSSFDSLAGQSYRKVAKQLLFDFDSLPGVVDNLEGMSWGPPLRSGRQSLVFVTDSNLFPGLATQLIFFSVSR